MLRGSRKGCRFGSGFVRFRASSSTRANAPIRYERAGKHAGNRTEQGRRTSKQVRLPSGSAWSVSFILPSSSVFFLHVFVSVGLVGATHPNQEHPKTRPGSPGPEYSRAPCEMSLCQCRNVRPLVSQLPAGSFIGARFATTAQRLCL